jgi:2-polyprenyl-3-methyl-5-hydroxy-6-metoxy-1,4-benzoquinol methylase
MRKDGDAVPIPGDYQYRALTEGFAVQRFWHHAKMLAVEHYLPPEENDFCLDAGCGSGVLTSFLGERAKAVLGIDCNPAAVEFATRQYANARVSFRQGLVDKKLAVEQAVDKIYCLEVIEHVYPEQAGEMLDVFHRVLRSGGSAFLTTPNARSFWPLIEWTLDRMGLVPHLAADQHVEKYHARKLAALCEAHGFEVRRMGAICLAAPWLAAMSWRWAEKCFAWEARHPRLPGSVLVAVISKA